MSDDIQIIIDKINSLLELEMSSDIAQLLCEARNKLQDAYGLADYYANRCGKKVAP
jgi:hypothetical protein